MIGSEAMQRMKTNAARSNPRTHGKIHKLHSIITILFVTIVVISFAKQEYAIYSMRKKSADLRARLEVLEAQNDLLKAKAAALNDDKYIEQIARDSLGLVKPGEIQYLLEEQATPRESLR